MILFGLMIFPLGPLRWQSHLQIWGWGHVPIALPGSDPALWNQSGGNLSHWAHALWACGGSGSLGDLWIVFEVLLPLSWNTVHSWIAVSSSPVGSKKSCSPPSFHRVSNLFSSNCQCFCSGSWLSPRIIPILISLSVVAPKQTVLSILDRLTIFQIFKFWFLFA